MLSLSPRVALFLVGTALGPLVGCGGSSTGLLTNVDAGHDAGIGLVCPPGLQLPCACPAGAKGIEVCDPEGLGYGPCLGCTTKAPDASIGFDGGRRDGGGGDGAFDAGFPIVPDSAFMDGGGLPEASLPDATFPNDAHVPDVGTSDAGRFDAGADAGCVEGANVCEGDQPALCFDGMVLPEGNPCVAPEVCRDGTCTTTCTAGALTCSGNQPQVCTTAGTWVSSGPACAETCLDGGCTGVCSAGATRCDPASNGVDTCTAEGQWGPATACDGETCVSGACSGVCAVGTAGCIGAQPATCGPTGRWQSEGAPCPSTEICVSGVCGTAGIPTTCAQADGFPGCCGTDGQSYYCNVGDTTVTAIACTGGQVCGWDPTNGYYDCVDPPATADPSGTYAMSCE